MARAFAVVLANLLLLLLIESALRVIGTVREDFLTRHPSSESDPEWFVYSPTLGWERKPGFRGDVAGPHEFDSGGFLTVDSRQVSDTSHRRKRVLFIGDSNTMGFQVAASATFAEVVEALVPNVDAINLGVLGYSSYQGRKVLEASLPKLKPDAIVISFNFNDRRSVASPRDVDGAEHFRRVGAAGSSTPRRLIDKLEWSYSVRALRGVLRRLGAIAMPAPPTESRLDSLPLRVDENAYRENLRAMAAKAREAGVPVVFLLLGDNPVQTYHLIQGIERLEAGEYKMAIDHLDLESRLRGPFWPLARRYLARTYEAMGDTALATQTLRIQPFPATLHGQFPIRLDSEYHAIMRAVAAEQNADLVDGVAVLNAHPEDFIDSCHFDADGHRRVGEVLATHLSRILASVRSR